MGPKTSARVVQGQKEEDDEGRGRGTQLGASDSPLLPQAPRVSTTWALAWLGQSCGPCSGPAEESELASRTACPHPAQQLRVEGAWCVCGGGGFT